MTRLSINGLMLNVEEAGSGPPLLLLHGFTGSHATWQRHQPRLAAHFRLIALDLPGHGQSEAPGEPGRYDLTFCEQDLVSLLDRLGIERAAVLGYSMGGRVALHFAIHRPERVSGLVLESATPGLVSPEERAARVESDNALADFIESQGVAAFVERWEKLPLWESQQRLSAEVREGQHAARLKNNPRGLANSLRGLGTGVQVPLWERLGELKMPVLLMAGELDAKFSQLASQMHLQIARSKLVIVPEAGHAIHLEQPAEFEQQVIEFLGFSSKSQAE